jgi:hypothetical protein
MKASMIDMDPMPFSIDEHVSETLKEYQDLTARFETMRDRLQRTEMNRDTVNRRVYEKVRAEYDREMDALRARMTPLREELDAVRADTEDRLNGANTMLDGLQEERAELQFRHSVGEFDDDAMQERTADVDARIDEARVSIAGIRDTLSRLDAATIPPAPRMTPPPIVETSPPTPEPEAPTLDAAPDEPVMAATDEPAAEASDEPVPATPVDRRPVLKPRPGDGRPAGFENPHDWIDEIGTDSARTPAASVQQTKAKPEPSQPEPSRLPPSLVFVSGPHAGQSIPLLQTTLTIGREHDNNIEIKDPDVARYHARILNERGEFVVEDMASSTGTWVNGERAQRATLGHGDVIRIGQTEIAVDFEWASNSLERAGVDPTA